jgi:hypothetical protein
MRKPKGIRQGDVLLKPVTRSQVSGTPISPVDGRYTLSEGEAQGHLHMIEAGPDISLVSDGITAFLSAGGKTKLVHEVHEATGWEQADHDPLKVGGDQDYEVIQQRRVLPGFEGYSIPGTD